MTPRFAPGHRDPARLAAQTRRLIDLGLEPVELSPLTTESFRVDPDRYKVSQVRPAMGTLVCVSVLADGKDRAQEGIGRAFVEMDRIVDLLNRYDPASAVACLNEQGRLADAPPELCRVVAASLDVHRTTGGAFDITVKPLVDLYRDAFTAEPLAGPSEREVEEAREIVGSEQIGFRRQRIFFRRQGMGVTLDGVAKGYIVDRMAATLDAAGIDGYLINAGGDIRTRGSNERGQPWTVAVRDPHRRESHRGLIRLAGGAVATSGSYEIYFDRERLSHHIVSSQSGRSPTESITVSVVGPTAMEADALATAAFVMGPARALALIDRLEGRDCLIVDGVGRQVESKGWRTVAGPAGTHPGATPRSQGPWRGSPVQQQAGR